MSSEVIFNFGLLFEDSFSRELVEISQGFQAQKNLDYVLGADSLPHVTILQFPGQLAAADAIWRQLQKLALPRLSFHFHGLAFDRFRDWDGIWLRMKHCESLRKVQESAAAALGALPYVNAVGALYEPHATLAAWPKAECVPAFQIPPAVFDRKKVPAVYSLGISGPSFQYKKCLFTLG